MGNAQVFQFRTPPPDVSAAGADWQMSSEPVVVAGLTYYPTRGFRFFDGQVMSQTGMYEKVPVYSDATLEPYMELYVPVGGARMRVYERRRERELAGTTGSHAPALPVESPSAPAPRERAVGTSGSFVPRVAIDSATLPDRPRSRRTTILTAAPRSSATNGVWLEFSGTRWYSNGAATSFSPDRFEPVGEYHGFPVYSEKAGGDAIWVSVVKDGPLAPYRRP